MIEKMLMRICTAVNVIQRSTPAAIVPSLENSDDVSKITVSRHHKTA